MGSQGENLMRSEAQRLSTFRAWPHNDKVEAGKIAKAGFFHTGNDSEVKCLWCGTVLNEWEYGDQVMARHRSANPECPFIRNTSDNVPLIAANNDQLLSPSQLNHVQGINQEQRVESQDDTDTPMEAQDEAPDVTNNRRTRNQEVNLSAFKSEAARLETFQNWPNRFVRPADLANTGFIYTGDGDLVRCVFCGQYVGNWEDEDFPSTEHQNLFPECPFVQGQEVGNIPLERGPNSNTMFPEASSNAQLGMDGSNGFDAIPIAARGFDDTGIRPNRQAFSGPEKGPNVRYKGVPPSNGEEIGIIRHSGPANSKYSTTEARLRTFKDWPPALRQKPKHLADAGFYYIGWSDQTKCFYCEGGLRNWQPDDDPWTEHARWFSKCGYVRLIKGDEFIAKCLDERPPEPPFSKDKPGSNVMVSDEELRSLMGTAVVREVLNMGIDQNLVQMVLKKGGKSFNSADELASAALSVQMTEQARVSLPSQAESQSSSMELVQPPRSVSAPGPSTALNPPMTTAKVGGSSEELSKSSQLEEENQRLKEARTCKICMDNEIGVVFLPCGHLICCVKCAPSLRDCPLCRQSIHGTVKTYMS